MSQETPSPRRPRPSQTVWSLKGDTLLADGEWHDGPTVLKAIERAVPPGIAERKAESTRASISARRNDGAKERIIERDLSSLIAVGQRILARTMLNSRIRDGSWEVDPPTLGRGEWRAGWRVRDLRVTRLSITEASARFRVGQRVIRELIHQDPPLQHVTMGSVTYVVDLDGLQERVQQYALQTIERRKAAGKAAAAKRAATPAPGITVTELALRSRCSGSTARIVCDANPQLGWIHKGRNSYLPEDQLDDWDKAFEEYRSGEGQRRSAAAVKMRVERRARRAAAAGQTPAE